MAVKKPLCIYAGEIKELQAGDAVEGAGGGGVSNGFSYFEPDAPYSSPSASDDEFNSSALDGKWTAFGYTSTLTHSVTLYPHFVSLTNTSNNIAGYVQEVPTINAKYRAKVNLARNSGSNYPGVSLIAVTAAGVIYEFSVYSYYYTFGGQINSWLSPTTFNSTILNIPNYPTHQHTAYLEIENARVGDTSVFRLSFDGIIWSELLTEGVIFEKIGVAARNNGGGVVALVDWFRKVDATGRTGRVITI